MPEAVFLVCVCTASNTLVSWFLTKDFIHKDNISGNKKIIMFLYSGSSCFLSIN